MFYVLPFLFKENKLRVQFSTTFNVSLESLLFCDVLVCTPPWITSHTSSFVFPFKISNYSSFVLLLNRVPVGFESSQSGRSSLRRWLLHCFFSACSINRSCVQISTQCVLQRFSLKLANLMHFLGLRKENRLR